MAKSNIRKTLVKKVEREIMRMNLDELAYTRAVCSNRRYDILKKPKRN